ncbi:hypothetical protein GSH19_06975 [Lactobacillus sp. S2-2]|uniref:hypothetical protein n=1 Tax=Lactobacillus sp. S2-2 TaxID=2692917 RepID=UPI001F380374|nr:hypothetical protein [Lactobacillus sp. S2-2]MCF6515885.1 hypothetical protein [Lactobacillus sp. S2-2]
MNLEELIIDKVNQLFTKKRNTIYRLIVVHQIYSKQINFYFEFFKIGHSIKSIPIRMVNELDLMDDLDEMLKAVYKATNITIINR